MTAPHTAFDLRLQADLLVLGAEDMTPEDFDAALASFVGAVEDKAAAYRAVYKALTDRWAALKAEAANFDALAKRTGDSVERVKDGAKMLLESREAVGEEPKIKATWGSMWLQKNGQPSMEVLDEAAIPDAFWVQPPPPPRMVSRERVLEAVAAGIEVPGVKVETGRHVRIK